MKLSALFHMKTRVSLKYFVSYCRYQILLQTNNFEFLEQICPQKGIFGQKWKKRTLALNFAYSN